MLCHQFCFVKNTFNLVSMVKIKLYVVETDQDIKCSHIFIFVACFFINEFLII